MIGQGMLSVQDILKILLQAKQNCDSVVFSSQGLQGRRVQFVLHQRELRGFAYRSREDRMSDKPPNTLMTAVDVFVSGVK